MLFVTCVYIISLPSCHGVLSVLDPLFLHARFGGAFDENVLICVFMFRLVFLPSYLNGLTSEGGKKIPSKSVVCVSRVAPVLLTSCHFS